jgi:Fe-S-cluster-containing hydrogenase component 2
MPTVRRLVMLYALAGVDCLDVAADTAVVAAARQGLEDAARLAGYLDGHSHLLRGLPWLMVSLNDSEDPHFRKAIFDAVHCLPGCDRPCETICPTAAIQFQAPQTGSVAADLCYGCGRCIAVCPIGQIAAQPYLARPEAFATDHLSVVDAVEIHTQTGNQAQFAQLWQRLEPWRPHLKLISISCPDHEAVVPYLRDLYEMISPWNLPLIWQTDGRPMSGDLGKGTTHAAIRLAQKILDAGLPGYVQPAGGTNGYTVEKLIALGLVNTTVFSHLDDLSPSWTPPQNGGAESAKPGSTQPCRAISGIAYGSYGRSQVLPFLETIDRELQSWLGSAALDQSSPGRGTSLKAAAAPWQRLEDSALGQGLAIARALVGQLKSSCA